MTGSRRSRCRSRRPRSGRRTRRRTGQRRSSTARTARRRRAGAAASDGRNGPRRLGRRPGHRLDGQAVRLAGSLDGRDHGVERAGRVGVGIGGRGAGGVAPHRRGRRERRRPGLERRRGGRGRSRRAIGAASDPGRLKVDRRASSAIRSLLCPRRPAATDHAAPAAWPRHPRPSPSRIPPRRSSGRSVGPSRRRAAEAGGTADEPAAAAAASMSAPSSWADLRPGGSTRIPLRYIVGVELTPWPMPGRGRVGDLLPDGGIRDARVPVRDVDARRLRDRAQPLRPEAAGVLAVLVRVHPVRVGPVRVLPVRAHGAARREHRLVVGAAAAEEREVVVDDAQDAVAHVRARRGPARPRASAGRTPGTGSPPRPRASPAHRHGRSTCPSMSAAGYARPGLPEASALARPPSCCIATKTTMSTPARVAATMIVPVPSRRPPRPPTACRGSARPVPRPRVALRGAPVASGRRCAGCLSSRSGDGLFRSVAWRGTRDSVAQVRVPASARSAGARKGTFGPSRGPCGPGRPLPLVHRV